ncbi:MAG: DUF3375 domain-containing protein, partial [Myxococcota bacterium]
TRRLLAADTAPLILSFAYRVFVAGRARSVAHADLVTALSDTLEDLCDEQGAPLYPRSAERYLDAWSSGEVPFFRKFYPAGGEEPEYDLTADTERAIEWLRSLQERDFVGTESRLLLVFQLLRELITTASEDPQVRLLELRRQRDALNEEIASLEGRDTVITDSTAIKERFFQLEDTARKLLSDFRQVEENFRGLDRETREQIATTEGGKGDLLDAIFERHDLIHSTDQGKSFMAFWELLLSPTRQRELSALIGAALAIPEIERSVQGSPLARFELDLVHAGERVNETVRALVAQLRKFLDSRESLERKRIARLIQLIEKTAVEVKEAPPPERAFCSLPKLKPEFDLPLMRGIFVPPKPVVVSVGPLESGESGASLAALYEQSHVDEARLRDSIRRALRDQSVVSLAKVVEEFPVQQGVAELLGYLKIATNDPHARIEEEATETVECHLQGQSSKHVRLPRVVFTRGGEA